QRGHPGGHFRERKWRKCITAAAPVRVPRGWSLRAGTYAGLDTSSAREKRRRTSSWTCPSHTTTWGVLFHDDSLERTTNNEVFLANTSFADLRQLETGNKNPLSKKCRGCGHVPTFEEGIQECLRQGLRFIIYVKKYDGRAVALLSVLFIQWPELYHRGLVSSPNAFFIYVLWIKNPDIVTTLTW
ncbi:hypothetical protein MRX96_047776, partial [Rhipicephalus microplus]